MPTRQPIFLIALCLFTFACLSYCFAQKPKNTGPKIEPKAYYEGLLGHYTNEGKPVPFVTLAIPNGDNMLGDDVLNAMRGKISIGEIGYAGTGNIYIAEDGSYEFDNNLGEILLNGVNLGFDRKTSTIEIKKGIYAIAVKESNHGQPYLKPATLTIRKAGTQDKIPIFNTGADIQRYLRTPGIVVIHPFDPEKAKLDIKPGKK